jgi:hypothetical protein
MENWNQKLKAGVRNGFKKGWHGYVWLLKILIPISFLTALFEYSGLLVHLDFILQPAMGLIHLPPSAAIAIIAGLLTGVYGTVAALTVIDLTTAQTTLVAVFILISHALIQEGVIQGKSGLNGIKAAVIRLLASAVTVWAMGFFLSEPAGVATTGAVSASSQSQAFSAMLADWSAGALLLSLQILGIVMVIMLAMETLKVFDLVPAIVKALHPFLRIMGLDRQVGLMWVAAIFFGISYGAAVIVEEARDNEFDRRELEKLHISIGVNHSMVEDPLLFLPFGLNLLWLWIPRIITAMVAVRLYGIWVRWRRKDDADWKEPATDISLKS